MALSYETKKKLSLLSGLLIHSEFGAIYTLGTVTPYIASYLKYHGDPTIQVVDVAANYPIMMICITIALIASTFVLHRYVAPKVLCFIGAWMFAFGVFISSFMESLWSFALFFSALCSLGIGTAYMSPIKNTYLYYPTKKGMCAGVCMMGYGVGSFIFNQIFRIIVNPHNLPSDQDHFFPREVADNFPKALRYISLVYFLIGTIGCLSFFDQTKQHQLPMLTNEHKTSLISSEEFIKTVTSSSSSAQEYSSSSPGKITSSKMKMTPWKTLQNYLDRNPSKKYEGLKVLLVAYSSSIFGVFIAYNYKQYGENIMDDDRLITILGSLGCVSNSAGRIFWCSVFDCLSFKRIMALLNSCLLVCCLLCIFVSNQYVYMVVVILAYFFSGSFYGIMPTQVFRIFGDEVGGLVYPFVYAGFALSSISQFLFHELGIRKWGNEGFKIAFIIFGLFQCLSIALAIFFKFTYTNTSNQYKSKSLFNNNSDSLLPTNS